MSLRETLKGRGQRLVHGYETVARKSRKKRSTKKRTVKRAVKRSSKKRGGRRRKR